MRSLDKSPLYLTGNSCTKLSNQNNRLVLFYGVLLDQAKQRGTSLVLVSHDARLKPFFTNEIAFS